MSRQIVYKHSNKDIKTPVRAEAFDCLFLATKKGALWQGFVPMVTEDLDISRATTYRIYAGAKEMLAKRNLDVSTRQANCGRKTKYDIPVLQGQLEMVIARIIFDK